MKLLKNNSYLFSDQQPQKDFLFTILIRKNSKKKQETMELDRTADFCRQ